VADFQPIFWSVKILVELFFWSIFSTKKKYQVGSLMFFSLNLVSNFKNWCNLFLFVKFLEVEQDFFFQNWQYVNYTNKAIQQYS